MTNRIARLSSLLAVQLLALGLAVGAAAQQGIPYHGPHMWVDGWHGWFFGPLMMVVMLAAIVAVVVLLVRWLGPAGHGPSHAPPEKTPLDILKERFARGEINREEFESRRRVLEE